jgi:UDP-N-acetylmuramoyl-L-alanyl-D-glutamate--2,6-diaminopimelate ligase
MDLASLVAGSDVTEVIGGPALSISSLVFRAQDAAPGSLFFCVRGTRFDGHDFAAQAAAAGAVAVVCERRLDVPVPQVVVSSVRRAMALMGATFYGDPSARLRVAAVTGTNGKTTTAHLMARCFDAAGLRSGLLGTVVNRVGGVDSPVKLTTPESLDLQRMFREMADAGDQACAIEASSHALALHRTVGIHFAVVVFTNLTRDHLDFHSDLEDYFLAKRRLFLPEEERQPGAVAVINVEDEFGRRLAADCRPAYGDADTWTFAVDGEADAMARRLQLDADGSRFVLEVPRSGLELELTTQMGARFNVENTLAAATAMLAIGLPAQAVKEGLEGTPGVPGRFESVRAGQPFTVLVDFSHTPDSLDNALRAARAICRRRLLVVFGCGGDRDRGKRPIMGEIAVRLADTAVVTSDNPRSEDPQAIIDDILVGIPEQSAGRVAVEADRRAAIGLALSQAGAGDVVVIAGKGHESGQIIGDRRIPFLDRDVANDWLRLHYGVVSSKGVGRGGTSGEPGRPA